MSPLALSKTLVMTSAKGLALGAGVAAKATTGNGNRNKLMRKRFIIGGARYSCLSACASNLITFKKRARDGRALFISCLVQPLPLVGLSSVTFAQIALTVSVQGGGPGASLFALPTHLLVPVGVLPIG